MKLEAVGKPFIYRWPGGEVRLEPGKPVELPPERAAKLLARASGRVRQVDTKEPVVIEPAAPNARPVYWERADGSISGPAKPEFLAKVGDGPKASFWVVAEFEAQPVWIRSDRLRSKTAFEQQAPVRLMEPVPRNL
jgi:hypothetical protein